MAQKFDDTAVSTPKHLSKQRLLLIGVVFLCLAAGVAWYIAARPNKPAVSPAAVAATLKKLYDGQLQLSNPSAYVELEDAYHAAQNDKDKIALLHALASADAMNKRYQAAIDHLLAARELGDKGTGNTVTLADMYKDNLKNNSKALKYYREALTSANQDKETGADPYVEYQIEHIQKQIKELEAKGVR